MGFNQLDGSARDVSSSGQRFLAKPAKDGKTVDLYDGARHVGSYPATEWEKHGAEMITAFSQGKAYNPHHEFAGRHGSPAEVREAKLDLLENGGDISRSVSSLVRQLAAKEAREGGTFDVSVEALDAEQWPALAREIFDSLYSDHVEEAPLAAGAEWVRELVNQAEGTAEWAKLREEVRGDGWATGIAAGHVLETLRERAEELLAALPKQDPERLQNEAEATKEMLGAKHPLTKAAYAAAAQAAEQAQQALELVTAGAMAQLSPAGAVMVDAAAEAKEEVEGLMRGASDLAGLGTGALKSIAGTPEALRQALAAHPNLKKIAELAGRLRIRARAKQRTKTKYAPESIVDVTIGGELERLLPSELMQLLMPQTKLLLMRKLQEREALQYELEGNEELDRGPVIMMVDSSGSMSGIRNQWAMAVAIAVLEIAAMQRRAFVLGHFDGSLQACFTVEKPSALKLDQLIEMVSFFSGGGTDFCAPLSKAHEIITSGKQKDGVFARADVMLITDGQARWNDWAQKVKSTGASLYGVEIESGFTSEMREELTGCAHVSPSDLASLNADVDLLFGI